MRRAVSLADLSVWPRRLGPGHVWWDAAADAAIARPRRSRFDALAERRDATVWTVHGLDQAALEAFVARVGARLRGLNLWKCPRLADLTPLEDAKNLALVAAYWNQRATALWDFRRTPKLRALRLAGFRRLRGLDDLRRARSLRELELGGTWTQSLRVESLAPLGSLPDLRSLALENVRIGDGRVQALGRLRRLRALQLGASRFTLAQMAWLRARLPAVDGASLAPIRRLPAEEWLRDGAGRPLDTLLVGKPGRCCNHEHDRDRIARHVAAFDRLVAAFRRDRAALPDRAGT